MASLFGQGLFLYICYVTVHETSDGKLLLSHLLCDTFMQAMRPPHCHSLLRNCPKQISLTQIKIEKASPPFVIEFHPGWQRFRVRNRNESSPLSTDWMTTSSVSISTLGNVNPTGFFLFFSDTPTHQPHPNTSIFFEQKWVYKLIMHSTKNTD